MNKPAEGRMPLADLLVFHQLTRSLTSSLDLDSILCAILEHMERTVDAALWTLLMREESSGDLYYALASGGEQHALRDLRVKVGEGVAGWVVEHGETLIVPETRQGANPENSRAGLGLADLRIEDPRLKQEPAAKPRNLGSVIALPLRGRKGTHGVIEIFNPRTDQMSDYTIAFLHILADHAAIAIENAQDVACIQQLTLTDDTTGLYNSRHLYEILARELDRKDAHPVSLAFLDLDRFKLVNDAHGHLVGSELLAQTGRRLRELSRKQDLCFRYGGDEFVILMPDTHAEAALVQMVQLHRELMQTTFRITNGQYLGQNLGLDLKVSASIGLATTPADGTTIHSIIGAADSRMYSVKSTGRGRVHGA